MLKVLNKKKQDGFEKILKEIVIRVKANPPYRNVQWRHNVSLFVLMIFKFDGFCHNYV